MAMGTAITDPTRDALQFWQQAGHPKPFPWLNAGLQSLLSDEFAGAVVVERTRIGRVMAGHLWVWKIVYPGSEAEVVHIGKQSRTGVPEMAAGEIVEIGAALAIVGINEVLKPEVEMIEVWKKVVTVVAEKIAVGKFEIVNAIVQSDFGVKENGVQ